MSYLISQMWLCLIITAIIAGIIGWLLRGNGKDKLEALDQQWREQYQSVDNARRKYANEVEQLSSIKAQNKVLDTNLLYFDEEISELKEEKKISKLYLEKMVADKEQVSISLSQLKEGSKAQVAELETKLHVNKADLVLVEEELSTIKAVLYKEKNQISKLKDVFSEKEKTFKEQLGQKESLLSLAIIDKDEAQKMLADTFEKAESIEKSYSSVVKDKFDNFNAERRGEGSKISAHKNKISSDIKSMFEATGISNLAKVGISKVRDRFDDMKK